ncbi:hypothetical protein J6590_000835 [Homalodisca vitripennis]|nr:hypothetical protein J6590_000835 [Homalodisca vitripennis]
MDTTVTKDTVILTPTAIPHVLHDGQIAETHEISAAKAEHFTAVAKAKSYSRYRHHYSGRYAGGFPGAFFTVELIISLPRNCRQACQTFTRSSI